MCRGDRQEWIFADDDDRDMFLATLAGSSKRKNYHGFEVRDHGEAAARQMIAEGLAKHGLKQTDLPGLPTACTWQPQPISSTPADASIIQYFPS